MTIKQLRAFVAVAQTLSFAQAGERLYMSQPALSLSIKALEDGLGGRLFSRTTRTVNLTPEGHALFPLARRLVAEWDNVEDNLRQHFTLRRGRVSIAAMPSFAGNRLPSMLMHFRERYPAIGITVHDVINEQVVEMVRNRQVELGITFEPASDLSMKFKLLYLDRFVAVVPRDSPLIECTKVCWEDLQTYPFITLQRPSAVRVMLEESLSIGGQKLNVAMESHQLATIGRMVGSGLGVSVVPSLCIQQMHELGAHCIPLANPVIERPIGMLTKADHELSVAAQALADILEQLSV
ncbi:LysR family transcriptional regulator [Pseudomonas sp. FME51]|uniref:LysR family transcriptional regulator n=1 Tax=Pseudomonas sp. FME51 TaxID=2742609 RepID=UPI00186787F5|nr:LysR family transcriptional regulator [Pseudomonas sp. FME51]